jgi:hypothetical protein
VRALLLAVLILASAAATAADRVALLIGNNEYSTTKLRNAVNDARDLGAVLKELGFRVIVRENATRKDMIDAIREFGTALEGANAAVFFYAGHGMQFKERNYLIPVDAVMASEDDITLFSIEVNLVFDRMERAKTRHNFIILDACRDNPFASSFKLSSSGLAQMSAPTGTYIAYATSPGSVARDGFERNGVYTKHILQNIRVPNQPVEFLFKRVREGVELETRRQQTPWDSSSLKGDFTFAEVARSAGPSGQAGYAAGPSADVQLQLEREFWVSVRESKRAEDIQAYLDRYPNGVFSPLARNQLNQLRPATPTLAQASPDAGGMPSQPRDPSPEPTSTSRSAPAPVRAERSAEPPPERTAERIVEKPLQKPADRPAPKADTPTVIAAAPPSAPPSSPPPVPALPSGPAVTPVPTPTIVAPKKDEQPGREIAPGVREVVFADGSIYKGGMRGFVQHGPGEYVSKAFQYQGEFKDGLKHGKGVYSWEGGDRYEGEFVDDRMSGRGKWRFANGDLYDGEVKAGAISGRGTYTSKSGDTFTGSFLNGKPHGVGVYQFASGDRYEGEMVAGALQGKGRYIMKSGDRIEAPFVNGRSQGHGLYAFANGDRYEGDIRDGALTGTGTYLYASGQKYEGEMRNGEPHGKGTYWFVDGDRFEGQFEGLQKATGVIVRGDARIPAQMDRGAVKLLN